jgi:cystathionine beta-lyase/cystathionine gamma-synthase
MAGRALVEPEEQVDLVYSRFNHPNAEILEEQICPLEGGATCALAFNSGMAAIMTAMMAVLEPGDSVVYTVPIYGGTQHFIQKFLEPWGVRGIPVQAGLSGELDAAIAGAHNPRIVLVETPANPTIIMTDIRAAVASAGRVSRKPLVMVDNTLMGPAFQHPLNLGADLVLYSATKYLSGFSDMLGGVVLASDEGLMRKIRSKRSMFGNILQPDECWMLDSRLPTVELRMNRSRRTIPCPRSMTLRAPDPASLSHRETLRTSPDVRPSLQRSSQAC